MVNTETVAVYQIKAGSVRGRRRVEAVMRKSVAGYNTTSTSSLNFSLAAVSIKLDDGG